ncbi:hypothetical protein [Hyalangium versicolor]|uniref:hypothetical protein n=1 Tax=Hyalangium versicolor TaxID=2861190 RepID=UPI001CCF1D82|nr:hypothetical protein [Hyalangium versicolor]
MTGQRRAASFIRYALPLPLGVKPAKPQDLREQGSKGKPKPVTTLAVGEESGTTHPGGVTSMAVGEEAGSGGG